MRKKTTFYYTGNIKGSISPSLGRPNLDFNPGGKGWFYVTTDLSQAQEWAARKRTSITRFEIPDTELSKLNIKTFEAPTGEWAEYVKKGRNGTLSHSFDAVRGPMLANPRAVMKGGKPIPIGSQMAIFSDRAATLFNKHKVCP